MNMWLDDVRPPPSQEWVWVRTAPEAKALLLRGEVRRVSLDHDLGDDERSGTGYDVAVFIEAEAHARRLPPLTWTVHSANPVGAQRMRRALEGADRWWAGR